MIEQSDLESSKSVNQKEKKKRKERERERERETERDRQTDRQTERKRKKSNIKRKGEEINPPGSLSRLLFSNHQKPINIFQLSEFTAGSKLQ